MENAVAIWEKAGPILIGPGDPRCRTRHRYELDQENGASQRSPCAAIAALQANTCTLRKTPGVDVSTKPPLPRFDRLLERQSMPVVGLRSTPAITQLDYEHSSSPYDQGERSAKTATRFAPETLTPRLCECAGRSFAPSIGQSFPP